MVYVYIGAIAALIIQMIPPFKKQTEIKIPIIKDDEIIYQNNLTNNEDDSFMPMDPSSPPKFVS